jgi:SsrA-binding protein
MENKIIATNRKAYFEYEISERWEAGLSLKGTEVKALREGRVNLQDGWVEVTDDLEANLRQVHISPYEFGNINNHDPLRVRKLLLNKSELKKIHQFTREKGYTLVPLSLYFKGQRVKVEIGLARGKKLHDKREATKEREANREMERSMKR